jgi:hypothetical protein
LLSWIIYLAPRLLGFVARHAMRATLKEATFQSKNDFGSDRRINTHGHDLQVRIGVVAA